MFERQHNQAAAVDRQHDLPAVVPVHLPEQLRRWLARDGVALVIFLALALATIAPVVPAMRSRLIGWRGENVQYVYVTGWMAQALLLGESPFYDPHLNYPDGLELTTTDTPYGSILLAAPLTWLFGPIFGYNAIMAFSALLSGYFVYLWVLSVTSNRFGAWVAGTAFLLTPYRMVQNNGHLQMTATYALPLFFWALDRAARAGAMRRQLALLAGAALLVGSNSQYYLVICVVTGVVYALAALRPRAWLQTGWKLAGSILIGGIVSALPYLWVAESGSFQAYNVLDTRIWSADPLNFVLPALVHPLWGRAFATLRPELLWVEKTLYLGTPALALAAIAVFWPRSPWRRQSGIWLAVALAGLVFALGTDLHLGNQPLQPDHPFWLPAYYLSFLPGLGLMRVWARFGIVTILFVALLAGLGAARVAAQPARWRAPMLATIAVLLVVDLLPGWVDTTLLEPRPVELWLARQPGDFAVAFVPGPLNNYDAMFGSLVHGKRLPGYNHPQHLPRAFREFGKHVGAFPTPESIEALRRSGLRYLLINRGQFDGTRAPLWIDVQRALDATPRIRFLGQRGDFLVVELL